MRSLILFSLLIASSNVELLLAQCGAYGRLVKVVGGPGKMCAYTIGTGTGSVTSVALVLPNEWSVSGSPVTTIGGFTVTKANQTANKVFAAPVSSTGAPTFRLLTLADIPSLTTGPSGAVQASDGSGGFLDGGCTMVGGTLTCTEFSGDPTKSGGISMLGLTSGSKAIAVLDIAGTATTYIFPSTNGTTGQVLTDNGIVTCPTLPVDFPSSCRAMAWTTISGGGSSPAGSDGDIQVKAGAALGAGPHWDETNKLLSIGTPISNGNDAELSITVNGAGQAAALDIGGTTDFAELYYVNGQGLNLNSPRSFFIGVTGLLSIGATLGMTAPQTTFAALPPAASTPDSTQMFCTDCKAASEASNLCVGSGTGAYAFHINGLWRCFEGTQKINASEPTCMTATDLVIDGTLNTKVTSVSHNFVAADVGAKLEVTDGVSWTTGTYYIVATAANAATLNTSPGAISLTGGTWNLNRSLVATVEGGLGVADTMRICSQDVANAFAWRALY